jgi:hypothetical protein
MNEQKLLIIVPDDNYHRKDNKTFLVYDFETGELIHESPYNKDLDCTELKDQGRPTFRPFGVTHDEDYIYVVSNNKLGKYDKKTFEYCGLVNIPLYINTHQVLKSDEDFYVAHTAVNAIGVHGKTDKYFDVSSFDWVETPEQPQTADGHDTIHLNSITEHGDRIYFCLHNLGIKPSEFGYLNKNTHEFKIVGSGGSSCHDVQIIGNNLYALSSGTGQIIEIDLTTGQTTTHKVVKRMKTFLRGMDVMCDKIIFVGSNYYNNDAIELNSCFVASFDTVTKETKRIFNINHADIVTCMKIVGI